MVPTWGPSVRVGVSYCSPCARPSFLGFVRILARPFPRFLLRFRSLPQRTLPASPLPCFISACLFICSWCLCGPCHYSKEELGNRKGELRNRKDELGNRKGELRNRKGELGNHEGDMRIVKGSG